MPISTIGQNGLNAPLSLTLPVVATTMGVGGATPSGSGSGITFPATQSASSDANTLDDYEEGTWTPTDASGAGLNFTSPAGVYTKIGRQVTLIARLIWPTNASTANAEIGGLPFGMAVGFPGFVTQYCSYTLGINGRLSTSVSFIVSSVTGSSLTNTTLQGVQIQFTSVYYTN